MKGSTEHPIARFKAPMGITAGQPLKNLFDRKLVGLIAESFASVYGEFDPSRFRKKACDGLEDGTMMERAAHIGDALAAELPESFGAASEILIAALGPRQIGTERNGLRSFFYMPHASFISRHGALDFEAGMAANYELTQRFTAEFSIRPFITRHQRQTLARLKKWTRDEDPHVRRLCSEGSRPRLPWASRLPALQADPTLALPLLETLKDDPELYVRRSVANHLGDVCKDHPAWVYDLCARWLTELDEASVERTKQRKWMIRHAVRLPAKKGVKAALDLRRDAKA
jgi:3-methyladenine DNA glycosylase AlkC